VGAGRCGTRGSKQRAATGAEVDTARAYAEVTMAAVIQGREPNLQAGADMSKHEKEAIASLGHRHQWSTPDEGQRIEKKDTSSLAHEMHEERRAERKGGKVEVATGCNELGGATHGELPSSIRKSRWEQCDTGLTCNARPATVVGQTRGRRNKWRGRRSCKTRRSERN
jgi:hypothetical protein